MIAIQLPCWSFFKVPSCYKCARGAIYTSTWYIHQKVFFSSPVIPKTSQAAECIPYVQSYFGWAVMSLNLL